MKLFWKVFLSIITVITIIFCISGHALIYSFFCTLLENEIEAAKKSNLSFCISLESAVTVNGQNLELTDEGIAKKASYVRILDGQELKQVTLYNSQFRQIYKMKDSNELKSEIELLKMTDTDNTGYEIREKKGKYYLVTVNQIFLNKNRFYVECINDVTAVFEQKDRQYQVYSACMLILIFVTAIFVLLLTWWIVNPIRELSQGAREIGRGEFSRKISVSSTDEIGILAEEFNHMSEKLEHNMEELTMAAVRQKEFTGSFAHELKTPLTSIIGYADMIRSKRMSEETRMIYGNYIFQQGKRLESLAKKMMDLIVLEKTDFEMREVFFEPFFEQIRDELQFVLKERHIVLETEAGEISLQAEPDLLKTVFLNMIDNSVKAIGENGFIFIRAEKRQQEVVVYVVDTGRGIPKKDIGKVTDSFYMVDKSRKYEGGSAGLGLAICKKVLELHHGKLEIESEEGKGTTMILRFEVEV